MAGRPGLCEHGLALEGIPKLSDSYRCASERPHWAIGPSRLKSATFDLCKSDALEFTTVPSTRSIASLSTAVGCAASLERLVVQERPHHYKDVILCREC